MTKALLILIALGLWFNVIAEGTRPPASAEPARIAKAEPIRGEGTYSTVGISLEQRVTTTKLPFFSEQIPGSVGERLLRLAYGLAQVVNVASVATEDRDQAVKVKTLKALREIVADLYIDLAAIDPVLPPSLAKIKAPDVLTENRTASADARAEARILLVREAYFKYRDQGGL